MFFHLKQQLPKKYTRHCETRAPNQNFCVYRFKDSLFHRHILGTPNSPFHFQKKRCKSFFMWPICSENFCTFFFYWSASDNLFVISTWKSWSGWNLRTDETKVFKFKNGSSKIYGIRPLKFLNWYHFKFFKGCSAIPEYFVSDVKDSLWDHTWHVNKLINHAHN